MATEGKTKEGVGLRLKRIAASCAPSVSGRSAITLSERDVLSALCERALSNSVPAHVLDQYPDGDEDDGGWTAAGAVPAVDCVRGNER